MNECACLIQGGPVVTGLLCFHSCLQTLQLSLCLASKAKSVFWFVVAMLRKMIKFEAWRNVSILLTGGCQ